MSSQFSLMSPSFAFAIWIALLTSLIVISIFPITLWWPTNMQSNLHGCDGKDSTRCTIRSQDRASRLHECVTAR